MRTQLALANPQQTDAHATLTFETSAGAQTQLAVDVPARSRRTVDLSTVPELAGASFSTLLESDRELALDRLISFGAQGSAASLETAVAQPSTTWYFAEGSTVNPQELFYLVQNPGATEARVRIRYLLPNGRSPVVRTADRRARQPRDDLGGSARTRPWPAPTSRRRSRPSTERRSWSSAAATCGRTDRRRCAAATPAPASPLPPPGGSSTARPVRTGRGCSSPTQGRRPPRCARRISGPDGRSLTRSYTLAPNSRQTVDVASVHPSLANTTLGITVEASAPIVVERTMWWGADGGFDEAVSGAGTTEGGARWLLAEGEMGGAREATDRRVDLQPGAATDVKVTLLFEDGPEATATFPVAAGARLVGADGGRVPVGGGPPLLGAGRRRRIRRRASSWIARSSGAAPGRRAPPGRMARRRACGNPRLGRRAHHGRDTRSACPAVSSSVSPSPGGARIARQR